MSPFVILHLGFDDLLDLQYVSSPKMKAVVTPSRITWLVKERSHGACPADTKQTLIGVAKAFREQVPGSNSYLIGQNEDVYPGSLNPALVAFSYMLLLPS